MRNLRIVARVALVILVAVACGTQGPTSTKHYRIFLSQYDQKDIPLLTAMEAGMTDRAKQLGYTLDIEWANYDASSQINQVQSAVARQYDFIAIEPLDSVALVPAYQATSTAKIPTMSFGNRLDPKYSSLELWYTGHTWEKESTDKTQFLVDQLHGTGKIAIIHGIRGLSFTTFNNTPLHQVLASNPNVQAVFEQYAKAFTAEEGLRLAQDALTAHPDITGFWVENDDLGLGVVQAMTQRGIKPGSIPIVSTDGGQTAVQQICNGTGITYTINLRGHTWGVFTMNEITAYLQNGAKPSQHNVTPPYTVVTPSNCKTLTPGDLT